ARGGGGGPSGASRSSAALVVRVSADIRNQAPATMAANTMNGARSVSVTAINSAVMVATLGVLYSSCLALPSGPGPSDVSPPAYPVRANSHLDIDNLLDAV